MSERPKVGDRVRVVLEGEVLRVDPKGSDLPFRVYLEGPNIDLWIPEEGVTVMSDEQPDTDRSDTALERRLRALEQAWVESVETDQELDGRVSKLEEAIPELQRRTQYIAESARVEPRVAELERVIDSLRAVVRKWSKKVGE